MCTLNHAVRSKVCFVLHQVSLRFAHRRSCVTPPLNAALFRAAKIPGKMVLFRTHKTLLKQRRLAGSAGISQKACYAQRCCFQPASSGSQSKCYWPYNAEISAYHAVAVSQGYMGPLGSEFLLPSPSHTEPLHTLSRVACGAPATYGEKVGHAGQQAVDLFILLLLARMQ